MKSELFEKRDFLLNVTFIDCTIACIEACVVGGGWTETDRALLLVLFMPDLSKL